MKNKIFIFLGLGSIIGLGYYFLQKTKPTISQTQLDALNKDTTSLIEEKLNIPTSSSSSSSNENSSPIYTPTPIYNVSPATLADQVRSAECGGLSRTECNKIIASVQNNIVDNSLGLSQSPIYVAPEPIYVTDVSQVETRTARVTSADAGTLNYVIGRRG